jgi:ubiquinone/menaquinone biosynthesis C-methylase UbiE
LLTGIYHLSCGITEMNEPERLFNETSPTIIREQWYSAYYRERGADRNSLLRDPGVLLQKVAQEVAILRALRVVSADPQTARVLDVGCGEGTGMMTFLRVGFTPANLHGLDFQEERIRRAKEMLPGINFNWGDATRIEFPDSTFDLVTESTLFIHSVDQALSLQIAGEMLRVARPGGHLILTDWIYSKPGSSAYKALSQKRIKSLFGVGRQTTRVGIFRGPLIPPIGRFLSSRLPSFYFLVQAMLPFCVGQVTTVLQKAVTPRI